MLRLTNTSQGSLVAQVFSYIELSFVDAFNDINNLDWAAHVVSSHYDEQRHAILAGTKFSPTTEFFASDRPPLGYDCDREAFVGPYRGLEDPLAVALGKPGLSEAARGNSIGSLYHEICLEPGAGASIVYVLGVTDSPEAIGPVVERYCDPGEVLHAFKALHYDWEDYLRAFSVQAPDADTTEMLNSWSPLQCRTTLYWSRFVSGYETGMGRGIGTRALLRTSWVSLTLPRAKWLHVCSSCGRCSSPTGTPGTSSSRSAVRAGRAWRASGAHGRSGSVTTISGW